MLVPPRHGGSGGHQLGDAWITDNTGDGAAAKPDAWSTDGSRQRAQDLQFHKDLSRQGGHSI